MGNIDHIKKSFDDIVEEDEYNAWSQICEECLRKLKIPSENIDKNAGNGICGVKGCDEDSEHYVDFK